MFVPSFQTGSNGPARISYWFMVLLLVLVVWLHLAAPAVACLFSYLALRALTFNKRFSRWIAVVIFLVLFSGILWGLVHFAKVTVKSMPEIAESSIPSVISWAKQWQIELPFSDYDSLKDLGVEFVKGQAHNLGNFAKVAKTAATDVLFLIAGCLVAISIFLNPHFELGRDVGPRKDLYGLTCAEIARRFSTLFRSFRTVMGAQVIISIINTALTGIFVSAVGLPYSVVVIGVTFICGLLPVVGNIISNTVVVLIGFTISPKMALGALLFLIAIHKLEYFLNSKIVGWKIRNPFWLTLLGLVVGERMMGVPGMVLAPVVLNYIKLEASAVDGVLPDTPGTETANPAGPVGERRPSAVEAESARLSQ